VWCASASSVLHERIRSFCVAMTASYAMSHCAATDPHTSHEECVAPTPNSTPLLQKSRNTHSRPCVGEPTVRM
jgi:hypothetical protein